MFNPPVLKRLTRAILSFWVVFLLLSSLVYLPMSPYNQVPEAKAAIAHVDTVTGTLTQSGSSIAVVSGTVTANADHFYIASIGSGNAASITVGSVTGLGLTWTQIDSQCVDRNAFMVSTWYGSGTLSGDGAVTANLSTGGTLEGAEILVSRYSGVDLASPIGNSSSANDNGVNGACTDITSTNAPSVTIDTTSGNLVYSAVQKRSRAMTWTDLTSRGSAAAATSGDISGVDVADITASSASTVASGTFLTATDWAIIAVEINVASAASTLTGVAYENGGTMPLVACDGSTKNISLSVATSTPGNFYASCADATGAFSVSFVDTAAAGDAMTLFIDSGGGDVVTTVVKYSGSGNVADANICKNYLILKNDSTGSITNSNLAGFDSDGGTEDTGDTDVVFTSNSNNLSVESNINLLINPGDTYDPGGTVTTQGTGDFTVSTSSVAYLDTASNTIAGDVIVDVNGGTGGTLYFDADTTVNGGAISATGTANLLYSGGLTPTVTLSGTGTVADNGSATSTFYNFTTSGSGTTTFGSDIIISNDLTVGSGTTLNNNGPHSITVKGGDATGDGTITLVGGTFTLTGTGSFGGASNWTFASTTIGNATVASTTLAGSITSTSTLTIGSGSYLFGSNKTIVLSTSTSPFTINGDFEPGLSTLSYRGTASQTITATTTYSIDFSPGSGTPTYSIAPSGGGGGDTLWYDTYTYRKPITIDATKVTSDFTNFPVLVSLTDSDLAADALDSGYDIAFFDASGDELDYDREAFNGTTGALNAWVKVTNLASTTDTIIYMAYGDADVASDQQDATNVWDTNYKGVWHLGDGDSTAANLSQDSTTGNSAGTLTDSNADS